MRNIEQLFWVIFELSQTLHHSIRLPLSSLFSYPVLTSDEGEKIYGISPLVVLLSHWCDNLKTIYGSEKATPSELSIGHDSSTTRGQHTWTYYIMVYIDYTANYLFQSLWSIISLISFIKILVSLILLTDFYILL